MTAERIRSELFALSDEKYVCFHAGLIPTEEREKIIGVRVPLSLIHILADNDTVQAQADKLAVKDAVVSFMQQELADSESVVESRAIIQKDMPKMKNIALETLKAVSYTHLYQ